VLQIGLSVGIAIVAGLFGRSFVRVVGADQPYTDPASMLVTSIRPPRGLSEEEGETFARELRSRVEAIPGVVSYSMGATPPYLMPVAFFRAADRDAQVEGFYTRITPRFFETHGVPMIFGREFVDGTEDDDGLIINQTLASILWPNESPLGRTVMYGLEDAIPLRVIGVAADEHCQDVLGEPQPCGWRRDPGVNGYARIRANGDAMALLPAVRQAVRDLSVDAGLATPISLEDHVRSLTGGHRTSAAASSGLAVLALVLVGLGCVSLFLAMVRDSAKEIAIRMAIGASGRRLGGRVLLQGLVLTAIGTAIGLALAGWASSRLTGQLYRVDPYDPLTYFAVPLLIGVVGLSSVGYAAWVATRTDPIRYLKAS
jgi:hypothetical protein